MSAVDVIVTNPPLEEANMPFASVVMMANGLGSTFSVTLPLLVNSTPAMPEAGAMLLVRLPMLSVSNGPEPFGRLTPVDTLPEQVTIEPVVPLTDCTAGRAAPSARVPGVRHTHKGPRLRRRWLTPRAKIASRPGEVPCEDYPG
jgi:hypothetical protein